MPPIEPPIKPIIETKKNDPTVMVKKNITMNKNTPLNPAICISIITDNKENNTFNVIKLIIEEDVPDLSPPREAKPPANAPKNQIPRIKKYIPGLANELTRSISFIIGIGEGMLKLKGIKRFTTSSINSINQRCPKNPCETFNWAFALSNSGWSIVGHNRSINISTTRKLVKKPVNVFLSLFSIIISI